MGGKPIDLTGKQFGYWLVLERAPNSASGAIMWSCKCTLCNETIKNVIGNHLKAGRSTCCRACSYKLIGEKNSIDETGKTYGYLYVNRRATEEEKPRHDRTGAYWNCTCLKCGIENVIVFGDYLRNGDTKSCGCIQSVNEAKIKDYFNNHNIFYSYNHKFIDCLNSKTQAPYLFDFYINNTYIIEYDGSQHFKSSKSSTSVWNTPQNLIETRRKDLEKNKYCFEHNIPLIRIPYDVEYTEDDLKLETTRFLLTPENEMKYYNLRMK